MIQLFGGSLVVLAVMEALFGHQRWPAVAQGLVLAAFATVQAIATGEAWFVAVAVLSAANAASSGFRAGPVTAGTRLAGATATLAAILSQALLSVLAPAPGLDILSFAVPVAASGLVLQGYGRTSAGILVVLRAALLVATAAASPGAALVVAGVLAAIEGRRLLPLPDRVHRQAIIAALALPALVVLPVIEPLRVAGIGIAAAAIHVLSRRRVPGVLCAAGLPLAVLGAAAPGLGPAGFGSQIELLGLLLNAAGLLALARARPLASAAADVVMYASIWTTRDAGAGLAVPLGLAVTAWAALVLAARRSPGHVASSLSAAHGGIVLCAIGLGTAPGIHAGILHMAGHALAHAGLVLAPGHRGLALLAMAGLPPSALFVSEFLLLLASGRLLLPIAAVLAMLTVVVLRRLPAGMTGRPSWPGWVPIALSSVLGAVGWVTAP